MSDSEETQQQQQQHEEEDLLNLQSAPVSSDKKLDDDEFEALDGAFGGDQPPPPPPQAQPVSTEPPKQQPQPQPEAAISSNRMLLCCSYLEKTDPRLKGLLLWSDPKRSGSVLFCSLTLLWACMSLSFVSVLAYLGLAALLCTCAVRLYAFTVKRSAGGAEQQQSQPQQDLIACLSDPIRLPRDCIISFVDGRLTCLEAEINRLLDLLLFRDSVRTLKFFCSLIVLTYIGSWFNALTLVSLALVTSFSLPKVYSVYHRQIDAVLVQLLERYRHVNASIRAAIPFGKEKKN